MTTKAEAKDMQTQVLEQLVQGHNTIQQTTDWGIYLTTTNNTPIVLFLHTGREAYKHLRNKRNQLLTQFPQTSVAHIINGDQETGLVLLGNRTRYKSERSLKHVPPERLARMIHLRQREKDLNTGTGNTYYRPKGSIDLQNTPQRITTPIIEHHTIHHERLDYSHLNQHTHGYGFAKNHTSKDYATPQLEWATTQGLTFTFRGRRADITPTR